jgi:HK97 family phage portal protein
MNLLQKVKKTFFKKEIVTEGGMELLRRVTGTDISDADLLSKYKKSVYVFACISAIARKVATTEFYLKKILNSAGDVKDIISHPALDLIYRPNPFQTKTEFLESHIINMKCAGENFIFKVKNNAGRVIELWNLRPDRMTVITDPILYIKEYRFRKVDGTEIIFDPSEIIHCKYANPENQYRGLSPMKPVQYRIQIEEYASKWQRNFFLNSARVDAVLKSPKVLTKQQRDDAYEAWTRKFKGFNNAHKLAILEGGMEFQTISISQKEMDYIESMKFTRDDILVAFHVPKPIVTIVEDVNRANSETAMYIFLSETIMPEIRRFAEKINEQMIYDDFGDEFFLDFKDQTPEDKEYQLREDTELLKVNALLINEVRQRRGYAPMRGGWSIYMPIILQPVGGLSNSDMKGRKLDEASMKAIYDDSDANAKAIKEFGEGKGKYDFRGRYMLHTKLSLREAMLAELDASHKADSAIKKAIKRQKGQVKEITKRSFLPTSDMKKLYLEVSNKSIDVNAKLLGEASNQFFAGQMHRVLGELAKKEIRTELIRLKKLKITKTRLHERLKAIIASSILKIKKEEPLMISFITPYVTKFLEDAGKSALTMLTPQDDFHVTEKIQSLIQDRAKFFAESVGSTTLEKLDTTLAEGISASEGIADLTNRVKDVYQQFPDYRSEMIARTEATNANSIGQIEGYRQSGIANGKEWINVGDARVREEHQDVPVGVGGEIVQLDDVFSNDLYSPEEPNCRCGVGPAFVEEH